MPAAGPGALSTGERVMENTNIAKVLAVFEAMSAQDADRAIQYVGPHFEQHYPNMAAGVEGFKQYIVGSTPEQLKLRVVRAFEDGPYVVTQVIAESSGQNMFAVYRFEGGLIAEHWAFSTPHAPPNKSGHTQLDGPADAKHLEDSEKNKTFARRYYETFHIAGDHSRKNGFFTGDLMIRHEPGVLDGLGEFLRDVEVLMQHRTIDEIKLLLGQGDLVFIAAKGTHEGKPCAYVDLYRVEGEKIVEHWGFTEMVPPKSAWNNDNGML
jgi:predicted SnoaL-like aldol condensation-catalyzing enzyme